MRSCANTAVIVKTRQPEVNGSAPPICISPFTLRAPSPDNLFATTDIDEIDAILWPNTRTSRTGGYLNDASALMSLGGNWRAGADLDHGPRRTG